MMTMLRQQPESTVKKAIELREKNNTSLTKHAHFTDNGLLMKYERKAINVNVI